MTQGEGAGPIRIHVRYPSGTEFIVTGRWHGPRVVLGEPNILGTEADAVVVEYADGRVVMLDPRGTYVDILTGRTLYRGVQG